MPCLENGPPLTVFLTKLKELPLLNPKSLVCSLAIPEAFLNRHMMIDHKIIMGLKITPAWYF
jgi:hypothetical protein